MRSHVLKVYKEIALSLLLSSLLLQNSWPKSVNGGNIYFNFWFKRKAVRVGKFGSRHSMLLVTLHLCWSLVHLLLVSPAVRWWVLSTVKMSCLTSTNLGNPSKAHPEACFCGDSRSCQFGRISHHKPVCIRNNCPISYVYVSILLHRLWPPSLYPTLLASRS